MDRPEVDSQITFLYTQDLAQTAHFYEQVMGFPLKLDQGACRIYQVSDDAYLGFCQRADGTQSAAGPRAGHLILTLVTPAVDEWYDYLTERGVSFEKPPGENPEFKIYHCFLRDPNGYLIEIQRFLHPF
jgi:catechol 2,3-dioxygenase-like lactoylglutathione lyase family enzyme